MEWLDSLRGIASLAVVLVHSSALAKPAGVLKMMGMTGQRGVQLFYLVSAFTIFLSFDRKREGGQASLLAYAVRRVCRIAPLFYLAILVHLSLSPLGLDVPQAMVPDATSVLLGLVFLHGLTPAAINSVAVGGWSIAVEAMFYVVAPFLHRHAGRIGPTGLLYLLISIGCVSGSWALALACAPQSVEYFTSMWFPVELPVFLIGILTYLVWVQWLQGPADVVRGLGERGRRLASAAMLGLCAVLLLMSMPTSNLTIHLAALAFAPLMIALAIHPWAMFVNPATRFVGRISFSIYLTHVFCLRPVSWLLARLDAAGVPVMHSLTGVLVSYAATLMLALPLAMVTYRWIEVPGIALGPRLMAWLRSVRSGGRGRVPAVAMVVESAPIEAAPSAIGFVR